jgi:hypothetical protein
VNIELFYNWDLADIGIFLIRLRVVVYMALCFGCGIIVGFGIGKL